jgi:hypothetical protein
MINKKSTGNGDQIVAVKIWIKCYICTYLLPINYFNFVIFLLQMEFFT